MRPCYGLAMTSLLRLKFLTGAGLAAARNPPEPPSVEDLEGIKTLDVQIKAWRDRAKLSYMQAEPLRSEAAALGVGKLTGLQHTAIVSWGATPAAVCCCQQT